MYTDIHGYNVDSVDLALSWPNVRRALSLVPLWVGFVLVGHQVILWQGISARPTADWCYTLWPTGRYVAQGGWGDMT